MSRERKFRHDLKETEIGLTEIQKVRPLWRFPEEQLASRERERETWRRSDVFVQRHGLEPDQPAQEAWSGPGRPDHTTIGRFQIPRQPCGQCKTDQTSDVAALQAPVGSTGEVELAADFAGRSQCTHKTKTTQSICRSRRSQLPFQSSTC